MKFQVEFFLLCENVIIDQKNKASIINLYDRIFAEKLPAQHPRFVFFTSILFSNQTENSQKAIVTLSVKTPSGVESVMVKTPAQFDIPHHTNSGKIGTILEIPNPILTEYGEYTAEILVNGKVLKSKVFDVVKGDSSAAA